VTGKIAGVLIISWFRLFGFCYEWHWDGAFMAARQKDKSIKSGFYTRVAWPDGGATLDQYNIVAEIFHTIVDEKNQSLSKKVR